MESGFSKHLVRRHIFFIALALPAVSSIADTPAFTRPLPPTQRVFIESINLSARDFFSAYMSKSVEERRYSETYLLGVLDSTEGRAWCDYKKFKTTTLAEEIYSQLVLLEEAKKNARASDVITEILGRKFPCHGGQ